MSHRYPRHLEAVEDLIEAWNDDHVKMARDLDEPMHAEVMGCIMHARQSMDSFDRMVWGLAERVVNQRREA